MRIQTVQCLSDNLSYLVVDDETRTCIVIDPGEAGPFFETIRAQSLRLVAILVTHHHYDHIGGLSLFPEVPVWSSQRDFDRVPGAGRSNDRHAYIHGKEIAWSALAHDESLAQVKISLRTFAFPGHTEGQTALILSDLGETDLATEQTCQPTPHVFVGDTVFAFGCGRCLEGTPEILFESLQQLKNLPGRSRIYFGHEYTERNALFWLAHANAPNGASTKLEVNSEDKFQIDIEKITTALREHLQMALPKQAPTLESEINLNPFLQIKNASEFRRWRELRDQF